MESKTGKNFQGICKKDIDEIKRLMNPPQLVKDELTTTVLLLGYTETQAKDWRFIRALLSKVGEESFLNKLHNIDCSKITTDTALKAKEWIKHVETSDQVKAVSLAGYQIHLWNEKVIDTVLAN